jgi:hypothetical protein
MPIRNSINNQSTGFTVNAPTSGTALTVTGATGSFAATFTGTNAGGISVDQSNGGAGSYQAVQSSVDVQPVYFNVFKNRAGGDINAGDILMQHNVFGYRGTNQLAASMRCYAETVGATRASGAFDWFTTSTAGVLAQRLYLSSDGAVVINTPAAAQSALFVNGFGAAGTYGAQFSAIVPGALFDGIRVINPTTTAGSSCQLECSVSSQALSTGGDPYLRFVNYGVNAVSIGLDTSTQQYAMTSGSGVGGANNFFTWSIANNQINMPLQCSFHAWVSTAQNNVTGDGAVHLVIFQTERYDVSSSYNNATGVFTAPISGKYMFTSEVIFEGITAGMVWGSLGFWVNGGAYVGGVAYLNSVNFSALGTFYSHPCTVIMSLNAGDTVQVRVFISGGARVADITVQTASFFAGQLLS